MLKYTLIVLSSLLLVTGYCSTQADVADIRQLRGGASIAGCRDCWNWFVTFYECIHFNPGDPNGTACQQNGCIENYVWSMECTSAGECQEDCNYTVNGSLMYRFQRARLVTVTEECDDPGNDPPDYGFTDLPNACATTCRPLSEFGLSLGQCLRKKCLISGCSGGTIWDESPPLNGRRVCDL